MGDKFMKIESLFEWFQEKALEEEALVCKTYDQLKIKLDLDDLENLMKGVHEDQTNIVKVLAQWADFDKELQKKPRKVLVMQIGKAEVMHLSEDRQTRSVLSVLQGKVFPQPRLDDLKAPQISIESYVLKDEAANNV
ncbi:hypothetical protein KI387_037004, partial [Taxus chinensis]